MKNYKRENLDVSILTQRGAPHMWVMNGKALLDEESKDMKFVENAPRGERSVEVGRTAHSRYVRRPDGMYTITLRLDGSFFDETYYRWRRIMVRLYMSGEKWSVRWRLFCACSAPSGGNAS